jgi:arylsulfatase A-like enzyme
MLSRRQFVTTSGAAALAAAQNRRRPNTVVFLADDLGCHDLGCWGAKDLETPHIDAIAAFGTRFTNWYSAAPVCAPARAALLTGRYPIRAGVPDNGPALPES